jgi:hypothetical protein
MDRKSVSSSASSSLHQNVQQFVQAINYAALQAMATFIVCLCPSSSNELRSVTTSDANAALEMLQVRSHSNLHNNHYYVDFFSHLCDSLNVFIIVWSATRDFVFERERTKVKSARE